MPQIDLEPKDRRFYDEKTRRWQTRIGRKFSRNYAFVCLAVLAFIGWHRAELSPGVLFGGTAIFAAVAGVMLANWLYDLY